MPQKMTNSHARQEALQREVFEDLAARFVLNCPDEARESWERLFFQIEAAHWHYEDFQREGDGRLPALGFKEFTRRLFYFCPMLQPHQTSADEFIRQFAEYKHSVPTFGCIMVNQAMDSVVLVRGWKAKSSFTFPKGKINRDESEVECAVREVFEETGYDCAHLVNKQDYLTASVGSHQLKLFLAVGVPETTVFETRTRKEIGAIEWFRIQDLPLGKGATGQFFLVAPFVKALKQRFLAQQQQQKSAESTPRKSQRGQKKAARAVKSEPIDSANATTFGEQDARRGWTAEDMFRVNAERFGLVSDYSYDLYTTKLQRDTESKDPLEKKKPLRGKREKPGKRDTKPSLPVPVAASIAKPRQVQSNPGVSATGGVAAPVLERRPSCGESANESWQQFSFNVSDILVGLQ